MPLYTTDMDVRFESNDNDYDASIGVLPVGKELK